MIRELRIKFIVVSMMSLLLVLLDSGGEVKRWIREGLLPWIPLPPLSTRRRL